MAAQQRHAAHRTRKSKSKPPTKCVLQKPRGCCIPSPPSSTVCRSIRESRPTPAKFLVQGRLGLTQILKREKRVFQSPTLDPPRRTGLGATSGRARRGRGAAAASLDGTRRVAATTGAADRPAGGRCGRNPRENPVFVAVAAARHQCSFGRRPGGRTNLRSVPGADRTLRQCQCDHRPSPPKADSRPAGKAMRER